MTRAALLAALAALLAAPVAAEAATAHTAETCPELARVPTRCLPTAFFTSAPGETNTVFVEQDGFGVRFSDLNPIEAQGACRNVETYVVECPGDVIEVRLGDLDDSVHAAQEPIPRLFSAFGEEGRDTLDGTPFVDRMAGGPGDDVLRSGDGDDLLYPGTGADRIEAGAGDDTLLLADVSVAVPGAPILDGMRGREIVYPSYPAPDHADGGPGRDAAVYRGAPAGIVVNLASGRTGGWATTDTLLSVADLTGGYGPDLLVGDDGPNRIAAGDTRYKARISGRGGNDVLFGGFGRDTLSGGEGGDDIYGHLDPQDADAARPDLMAGGPGDDIGAGVPGTVMDDEVEWARLGVGGFIQVRRRVRVRGRSAPLLLRAPSATVGRLVLRDRRTDRIIGIAPWESTGAPHTVLVRLPREVVGRLVLIPGGEVPVALSLAGDPAKRAPITLVG